MRKSELLEENWNSGAIISKFISGNEIVNVSGEWLGIPVLYEILYLGGQEN